MAKEVQEVQDLTVRARGEKREIHPTVLTSVELEFEFEKIRTGRRPFYMRVAKK
jgi:hypothetical protein